MTSHPNIQVGNAEIDAKRGWFVGHFIDQAVMLSKPGDFVMWGEGHDHKSRSVEDSVVLTVRWPSIKQR